MSMAASKPTAWDLESRLMDAIALLEDVPEGAEPPEELQVLVLECMDAAVEKRDALAGAYQRKVADMEALVRRAQDAELKARRVQHSLKRFDAYLLNMLDLWHTKQIRGEQYKIGWQQNPPHVELDEGFGTGVEERAYMNVKLHEEPNKKAITEHLKTGGTLLRARLVDGSRRIVIR